MKPKIIFICFAIFAMLNSCKKETEPQRMVLVGIPTAFVLNTKYISHTDSVLTLEMTVGAVTSRDRDYTYLDDSAFREWYPTNFNFTINKIIRTELHNDIPFSTILAFDQSATYNKYDPLNQRLRAVNKILLDMDSKPGDELGLAYFNRAGLFTNNLEILTSAQGHPFNLTRESLLENQFWMPFYEKGTANMYDAVSTLIDTVAFYSKNSNKSVTVFIHAMDDLKGATYKSIIDKAIAKGVKINIISLDPLNKELTEICSRTGGFLHLIDSRSIGEAMDKGVPALTSILKIENQNLNVFKVQFSIRRNFGTFYSGFTVNEFLLLREHYIDGEEKIYNPLGFYVKIP